MGSPILIDTKTSMTSSSRPATMAVTINNLSNRFLFFGTTMLSTTSNPNSLDTVAWNGTGLTLHGHIAQGSYNSYLRGKWFYLINPEPGDYNLEFTYAHATRNVDVHYVALALYNVKPQAPRTIAQIAATGAGPIQRNPVSVVDDWVLDVSGHAQFGLRSWTPGANQNVEYNVWWNSPISDIRCAISRKVATGSTTNMWWDISEEVNKMVLTTAAIEGVAPGSNQTIWAMSKIYDRIQKNRKKWGIGDLGNFGRGFDGFWKPKSGLVTI